VPLVFYPLGLSILFLAIGTIAWNRLRVSRWFCALALLLLLAFSSPVGSGALLRSLENQYPDPGIEALPHSDAIVVLGGNIHMPNRRHGKSGLIDESDRLLQALRLYRAGKASVLVCTGGGGTSEDLSEARVMSRLLQEWGVPAEAILLEEQSLNTRENALYSYPILKARGIRHILLVTSAIHMPRAAAVFKKAGFDVSPAPADFRTGWGAGDVGFLDCIPEAVCRMRSDRALREWVGLLVYRLRGWV
jgi:uncharacterized SAM-binding protein YcdF (DUF218 family)